MKLKKYEITTAIKDSGFGIVQPTILATESPHGEWVKHTEVVAILEKQLVEIMDLREDLKMAQMRANTLRVFE